MTHCSFNLTCDGAVPPGISHHHIRRHSQAVEDLKQAARLDPNIPNIARYIRMAATRR